MDSKCLTGSEIKVDLVVRPSNSFTARRFLCSPSSSSPLRIFLGRETSFLCRVQTVTMRLYNVIHDDNRRKKEGKGFNLHQKTLLVTDCLGGSKVKTTH